jgi:hypothetical protein
MGLLGDSEKKGNEGRVREGGNLGDGGGKGVKEWDDS